MSSVVLGDSPETGWSYICLWSSNCMGKYLRHAYHAKLCRYSTSPRNLRHLLQIASDIFDTNDERLL